MVKVAVAGASGRRLSFSKHPQYQFRTNLRHHLELAREVIDGLVKASKHEIIALVRKVWGPLVNLSGGANVAYLVDIVIPSKPPRGSVVADKLRRPV